MSYKRDWYLDRIFSTDAILLTAEPHEGSRPVKLFDVSSEGNIDDAYDTVFRALQALDHQRPDADNVDRTDAILSALGLREQRAKMVPELRRAS